jgi:hypothetical protein
MARATHKGQKGRTLKFLSLLDPNVWDFKDLGTHSDGKMSTTRAQLDRNVDKLVEVDDRKMPLYVLAETPERILRDDDPLDAKLSNRQTGQWYLPTPEWLEVRERKIQERSSRRQRARKIAESHASQQVVKGLAKFIDHDEKAPVDNSAAKIVVDEAFIASTAAFAAAKAAGASDEQAKDEARSAAVEAMRQHQQAKPRRADDDELAAKKAGDEAFAKAKAEGKSPAEAAEIANKAAKAARKHAAQR